MPTVFSKPATFSAYLTSELAERLNAAMPTITNTDLAGKATTTVFKRWALKGDGSRTSIATTPVPKR